MCVGFRCGSQNALVSKSRVEMVSEGKVQPVLSFSRWAAANVDALYRINELMCTCVFRRRGINHRGLSLFYSSSL